MAEIIRQICERDFFGGLLTFLHSNYGQAKWGELSLPQNCGQAGLALPDCDRKVLRLARWEFCLDVCDRPIESDKLGIVDLGDIDAEPMMNGGNEV